MLGSRSCQDSLVWSSFCADHTITSTEYGSSWLTLSKDLETGSKAQNVGVRRGTGRGRWWGPRMGVATPLQDFKVRSVRW